LRAQCLDVATGRELAARGVDHPNLHFQMRGHRRVLPDASRRSLPESSIA